MAREGVYGFWERAMEAAFQRDEPPTEEAEFWHPRERWWRRAFRAVFGR